MVAHEVGWQDLLAHPDVTEVVELRSAFGLMAFHGGVEAGTSEIARLAARASGASLYAVDQPAGLRWHVPSKLVDPADSPALAGFLGHVTAAVALHGYGRPRPPHAVLVGGTNRGLAEEVAGAIRAALPDALVVDDLTAIPSRLRGLHPDNPVNRVAGGGVQVELPVGLRRDWTREVADALAVVARRGSPPARVRPAVRRPGRPPG
ncbi:poly-gamma-glutamate hydrolase family protein [Acidiferrimicrobium sp. IK]|uniref:poly-gamma-glutamate hydrolase family protein n=1 Tax=Acidiferrimicrobium sp. IK TaxID=2871700 RepID=UPI0021CB1DE4|nr:poly-gamma-glutamate hydrolase family protein [Acidiferrimicrobium sp. IK]MCU4185312.1 poly-gamma-glutamate hydrolase family protein [Acidiferrimicrobium sp. IK]